VNQLATVSAKKMTAPKRGPVRSMHIERLDDGTFTSDTRYAPADMKDGDREFHPALSEKGSHKSHLELARHVKSAFGPGESAKHEAGESKAEEATEESEEG
jgi:hypothetical protein